MEREYSRWMLSDLKKRAAEVGVDAQQKKSDLIAAICSTATHKGFKRHQFDKWTVAELRKEMKERNMANWQKCSKAEAVKSLFESDAQQASSGAASSQTQTKTTPSSAPKSASPAGDAQGSPPRGTKLQSPPNCATVISPGAAARSSPKKSPTSTATSTSPKAPSSPLSGSKRSHPQSPPASPGKQPRGILSPGKKKRDLGGGAAASESSGRRDSVRFDAVKVREYERRHGGGGGVPHSGAYPLGLDWKVAAEEKRNISEYEQRRQSEGRRLRDNIMPVPEQERKHILEATDARDPVERAKSFVEAKRELGMLKHHRGNIGCECKRTKDGLCGKAASCYCFANQLECCYETCGCDLERCENPFRD